METSPQVVVDLAGFVSMDAFNRAMQSLHPPGGKLPAQALINLEDTTHILVECLTALIAEVAQRQRAGLTTTFRLPLSRAVRGFMRTWGFARAFRNATGLALMTAVESDSLQRVHAYDEVNKGGSEGRYGYEKIYETLDGESRVPLDLHRFFGFQYWSQTSAEQEEEATRFDRLVVEECARWTDPVLERVLYRQLGKYGSYVSTVVHEALTNAFRHGGATSILDVSNSHYSQQRREDKNLTLVFWDNGVASYSTLRSRLDAGETIIATSFESSPELVFNIKPFAEGGLPTGATVTSRKVPTADSPDWHVVLSALFPGISADPAGAQHFSLASPGTDACLPGRGLSNLINSAVDVLGGTVAFRSGEYFMNISSASPETPLVYAVKITKSWSFFGNMITVRLPLN
ncbi:MAG TPA: hypothetical protein VF662_15000 [Allosphingosinicella sp.]|jgi:hypothetical protein